MVLKDLKEKLAASGILTSPLYLKYHQFIVPGTVLVIAILITVLVTIPQFLRLFETFNNIRNLTEKKSFFQTKVAALQAIDQVTYQKNLDTALLALPVDKNIPGVTGELLVALSNSGMNLIGITFSNSPPESEKVEEFVLKIDVTGSEESLKNFLDRVKLTPRLIKLASIEVGKAKNGTVSASVGFVTLYQQLPKNIGAVEEPIPTITKEDVQVLADIEAKAQALPRVDTNGAASGTTGKLNPFAP